jgi:uncharacterized protein YjbI with pentapeptide repeats
MTQNNKNYLYGEKIDKNNLMKVDFANLDLRHFNLSFANLREANLSNCNLSSVCLDGSNLIGANLSNANLNNASAIRANLNGANLADANLNEAKLMGAFFLEGASLERAKINNANLTMAQMVGVSLENSDLRKSYLHGTNLSNANLKGACLLQAEIHRVIFTGAFYDSKTQFDASFNPIKEGMKFTNYPNHKVFIEDAIGSLNYISECSNRYLGHKLTAKFLAESRPQTSNLNGLTIDLRQGQIYIVEPRETQIEGSELQAFKIWLNNFINNCAKIIVDFPDLIDRHKIIFDLEIDSKKS